MSKNHTGQYPAFRILAGNITPSLQLILLDVLVLKPFSISCHGGIGRRQCPRGKKIKGPFRGTLFKYELFFS
jgi:hypothetical protein